MCKHTALKVTNYNDRDFYFEELDVTCTYTPHIALRDKDYTEYKFFLKLNELTVHFDTFRCDMENGMNTIPIKDYYCYYCDKLVLSKDNITDLAQLFNSVSFKAILKYFEKIGFENKNV